MSSVGLSDIPRTTSFRLALLFLGLFGTASFGVFGFLYWQTAGYLAGGGDDWLRPVLRARRAQHSSKRRRQLDAHTVLDPAGQRPFALFDATGNWIGGSPATLPQPEPAMDHPFDFMLPRDGQAAHFRGMAPRLSSRHTLLIAQDMREIPRIRDLLLHA